ncbi:MAG: NUDIX domain-containing protein [Rhodospirillaceae bacterium]
MTDDNQDDDIRVTRKETPFDGYFRIDRYHLRHRQFAGHMGPEITREIFERGHAAAVLPYDPDLDRLVFIEQFRAGAFAARTSPWYADDASAWLFEIVAGIIEDGEDPANVVRREAIEEAGCEIQDLELIYHYLVTPGGSSESMYVYVGLIDASNVGGVHGLADEGEDIRVFTLSPEEAFEALDDGRIHNSMTIIPVQWFRQHRDRLREKWRRRD